MPARPPSCCTRCSKSRSSIESDELDRFIDEGCRGSSAEAVTHFPELTHRVMGPDAYLAHIAKCKQAVKIPVIASLNGTTKGGWLDYAKQMEQAGADALELNIYYIPVGPRRHRRAGGAAVRRPGAGRQSRSAAFPWP